MNLPSPCPTCGKPLAAGAPQGLCAECLMQAGFASTHAAPAKPRHFVPPTPAELAPFFPQLEITSLVGQGGMGAVYRARQPALDRVVALKILSPDPSRDPAFAERFTREARALAKLSHPNIVAVHDYGQAGGFHYLIMEFVDGVNLRQLLNAARMAPKEALAIVPPICEALQFAHDHGVVHRDIKPENILIGKNGVVKIADFGLAKLVGANAADLSITGAGDVMGTPHYMAPEQVEHPLEVDHRADIYSVGVVFYQMLTGELPLGRFAPPSRKVQIDVRLDEVVLRALEKEPEQRYQQASGLKTAVETIASSRPAPAPAAGYAPASGRNYKSRLTFWGLPLLHVATGIDPATGKHRVAKGVVAIGTTAIGLVAIGAAAYGGITFGGLSIGVLAFGGTAIGAVSVGGCAIAALFAVGGLAIAPVAVGLTAIGYLAFGNAAFGVHAMGRNAADPRAWEFFLKWVATLFWTSTTVALAIGAIAPLIALTGAWRSYRAGRRQPEGSKPIWVTPLLWVVAALLMIAGEVSLAGVQSVWSRYAAREHINSITPVAESTTDPSKLVTVQAWLVEAPEKMVLDATTFNPRRPVAGDNVTIRPLTGPVAVYSGNTYSMSSVVTDGGRPVRFNVCPKIARNGYDFTLTATLYPSDRTGQNNSELNQFQPAEKQQASVSDRIAADAPVFLPLGNLTPNRKHVAVFVFRPRSPNDGSPIALNATGGAPDVRSSTPPPTETPPAAASDFDLMESDPEILGIRIVQTKSELEQLKARFDAGLSNEEDLNRVMANLQRLEARLKGDRVAFASATVAEARKSLDLVKNRSNTGVATQLDLQTAKGELEIAETHLRRAQDRQRTPDSSPSARSSQSQGKAGRSSTQQSLNNIYDWEFDTMENNAEILRIQLRQAEANLDRTAELRRAGIGSKLDVQLASDRVAFLKARLVGDRLEFAKIKVGAAEQQLRRVTELSANGLVSNTEVQAANARLEIEKIRLREAEATAKPVVPPKQ